MYMRNHVQPHLSIKFFSWRHIWLIYLFNDSSINHIQIIWSSQVQNRVWHVRTRKQRIKPAALCSFSSPAQMWQNSLKACSTSSVRCVVKNTVEVFYICSRYSQAIASDINLEYSLTEDFEYYNHIELKT